MHLWWSCESPIGRGFGSPIAGIARRSQLPLSSSAVLRLPDQRVTVPSPIWISGPGRFDRLIERLVPPVRKLARDLGLVYLKGHDRFDSLGGPSASWPADGLACTDGRRARQGSGGPGSADSAEAGSSSRAGAAADGGRRWPRGCG